MPHQPKPQKRSKIALLLGLGTLATGAWVVAYLAYFQPRAVVSAIAPMVNTTALNAFGYEGTSFSGHYLAGRFAESEQHVNQAAEHMKRAISLSGDNLVLMQEALRSLIAAGDMDNANKVAERMLKKESVDPLATLVRISYLAKEGQFKDAESLIDKPAAGGVYPIIKPAILEWLKLGEQLPDTGPIVMQDAIDRAGFFAPFMHYQIALMNDLAGYSKDAHDHYQQASQNPQMMPYRLVQAVSNFYLRQGNKKKAQKVYDDYAEHNPSSELIPDSLPQGDVDAAAVVPLVENPAQGVAEILFTTASLLFGEQVTMESMMYLQLALYLRPDFPPAQLMLANLYEQMNDHQAAIDVYKAIDNATVFYKRGRFRTALNYQAMDDHQKTIGLLMQLTKEYPNDPEPLITLGDVFRIQKDFKQSAYFYTQAIEHGASKGEDGWAVFYARGVSFERSGEWAKAETDFRHALEISPGQPDVLNYLGYSWLVKNENLKRAARYIEEAFEQRPSDAHIIDSMGWARYMTGHFKDALEYLEQAADITPQDATINEHLGDIYWRLGRHIEAKFQWQRALDFDPEDRAAVQKKIDQGLPAFTAPTAAMLGDLEEPVAAAGKEPALSKTQ